MYSYSWADLKDHCRKYGEVTYTDAHFRTGEGKGEVCFAERDDLEKGIRRKTFLNPICRRDSMILTFHEPPLARA